MRTSNLATVLAVDSLSLCEAAPSRFIIHPAFDKVEDVVETLKNSQYVVYEFEKTIFLMSTNQLAPLG